MKKDPKSGLSGMRVFSYSVAGVLGLLMISSTLKPILGDSSERALIDAPLHLVTAPIKGVVEDVSVAPGDTITVGTALAIVRNGALDKSKLIELDVKISDLENDVTSQRRAIAGGEAEQRAIEQEIENQRAALIAQYANDVAMATAGVAKAEAEQAVVQTALDREERLREKGLLSAAKTGKAESVEAAASEWARASSELEAARDRLEAARNGIYMGDAAGPVNGLVAELRARRRANDALVIDLAGMNDKVADLKRTREEEAERVARLSNQAVLSPIDGTVIGVGSSNGTTVSDGDAIATAVDCKKAFVVAIFSERKADDLHPGAAVTVQAEGWDEPVSGRVRQLVPRTTSIDDAGLAVPLPPTERRELYAYVDFVRAGVAPEHGLCEVGKWVSVSLGAEPPMSLQSVARMAGDARLAASAFLGRVGSEAAEAARRTRVALSEIVDEAWATELPESAEPKVEPRAEAGSHGLEHVAVIATSEAKGDTASGESRNGRSGGITRRGEAPPAPIVAELAPREPAAPGTSLQALGPGAYRTPVPRPKTGR